MQQSPKDKKRAENEVVFRNTNQRVAKELKEIQYEAKRDGDLELMHDKELPIYFYCECADEACHERIRLMPATYQKLHANSSQFVILPGHNVPRIERVIKQTKRYMVVQKYMTPPQNVKQLNRTK